MAKARVLLSLLTWEDTTSESLCRSLLQLLYSTPETRPGWVNNFEPIDNQASSIEDVLAYAKEDPFLWRTKRPIRGEGGLYHGYGDIGSTLTLEAEYVRGFDWLSIFRNLIEVCRADYGYLHLATEQDRACSALDPADAQSFFSLGAFSKTLGQGFLELGWANYFGPRWVSKLGGDQLSRVGLRLEQVGGGIIVPLSDELSDVESNYETFLERRATAKTVMDPDLFKRRFGA